MKSLSLSVNPHFFSLCLGNLLGVVMRDLGGQVHVRVGAHAVEEGREGGKGRLAKLRVRFCWVALLYKVIYVYLHQFRGLAVAHVQLLGGLGSHPPLVVFLLFGRPGRMEKSIDCV